MEGHEYLYTAAIALLFTGSNGLIPFLEAAAKTG